MIAIFFVDLVFGIRANLQKRYTYRVQKFNPEIILHVAVFSRGKPQKHSYGAVCADATGNPLVSIGKFVGIMHKNEAIEAALKWSLEEAHRLQAEKIEIRVDDPFMLERVKPNSDIALLLNGFRFFRAVPLEPQHEARTLAEKAQHGWREILKK